MGTQHWARVAQRHLNMLAHQMDQRFRWDQTGYWVGYSCSCLMSFGLSRVKNGSRFTFIPRLITWFIVGAKLTKDFICLFPIDALPCVMAKSQMVKNTLSRSSGKIQLAMFEKYCMRWRLISLPWRENWAELRSWQVLFISIPLSCHHCSAVVWCSNFRKLPSPKMHSFHFIPWWSWTTATSTNKEGKCLSIYFLEN